MDEKPPVIIKLLLLIGVGLAWTSLVTHRFDLLHGTWSLCTFGSGRFYVRCCLHIWWFASSDKHQFTTTESRLSESCKVAISGLVWHTEL